MSPSSPTPNQPQTRYEVLFLIQNPIRTKGDQWTPLDIDDWSEISANLGQPYSGFDFSVCRYRRPTFNQPQPEDPDYAPIGGALLAPSDPVATRDVEEIKRLKAQIENQINELSSYHAAETGWENELRPLRSALSATEAECARLREERDKATTELVNAKQAWLDSADPDKGPYVPWEDHAAAMSERDAAAARVAELSERLQWAATEFSQVGSQWRAAKCRALLTAPTRTEGA